MENTKTSILSAIKDVSQTYNRAKETSNIGPETVRTAQASLDGMITRMETLKRKLETVQAEEKEGHRHTRARMQHVQDLYDVQGLDEPRFEDWSKIRLNRLLVDYLLRSGHTESARGLAERTEIEDLVDIEAFQQCTRICKSLQQMKTQEALAWCGENKQTLKKMNVSNSIQYIGDGLMS